jgi:beta-galactosidase
VADYFAAVAGRYGHSPALSFYNVWNEPHYSSAAPHVIARFRTWLQKKYGTLAALRRAWGDDYADWSEVTPFLNDDWNSSMPGIDWALFRTELDGVLLGELTAVLRRTDPVHPVNANPVGTPFASGGPFTGYGTDAWQFTAHEDFAGASYYPDLWAREQGVARAPLWFHNLNFDVFRCAAGDRGYILTELYTNAKSGLTLGGYLDAATARQVAWTALANDCKGLIYWKWQPFMRGRQSLGRGLVGLDGQLAPRGEAVRDFAAVIQQHGRLLRAARLVPAEAGIIVDLTGMLKTQLQTAEPRTQNFMQQSIAGVFRALDEANITADLLRADLGLDLARLQRYKILFLPFQIVVRRDLAPVLRAYVEAGGCLVADARTASIDELDYAYTPSPGAGLDSLFGADRKDWIATPGEHRVLLADSAPAKGEFDGKYFREQLRPHPGAAVLGTFPDNGEPALISNHSGRGTAIISAVPLGASYFDRPANSVNQLLLGLCGQAGVTPPATFVPTLGVTPMIRVHQLGDERVVYLLNPGAQPLAGELVLTAPAAAGHATELLSNESVACRREGSVLHLPVRLAASGVQVFHVTP